MARISGPVEFDSEPRGAEVVVDRQTLGRTPMRAFLPGGAHTAEFRLDGHFAKTSTFTVSDKAHAVPVHAILPKIPPGLLSVEREVPGAEIFVDGKAVRRGSVEELRLEPGKHVVRVLGEEREVEVEAGALRKVAFTAAEVGMAFVPAGPFQYGSREMKPGELLPKTVELPAYFIDVTEVTNAKYAEFLSWLKKAPPEQAHARCNPSEGRNKDHTPHLWGRPEMRTFADPRQPVVGVDFYDAWAYAAWAGKRLPSEEEWEKAARGTDGRRFPWGDQWSEEDRRCNWYDFRGERDGFWECTAPVGSFESGRSPYGVHDMAGNVWEWTSSYHDHPRTPNRMVRGGGFLQKSVSVWARDFFPPTQKELKTVGFRCVADAR
jgi:formylglycine-generating enzyme required for sulfatase activity